MQIVNEEKDRSTAIKRRWSNRTDRVRTRRSTGRRDLRLFVDTSGSYFFEELNWLRRSIDPKFEVTALQTVYEMAFLVENHDVRLHNLGEDAKNVRLILNALCLCVLGNSRRRLSLSGK